jgi:GNAT superfamily N-acetyltransferase
MDPLQIEILPATLHRIDALAPVFGRAFVDEPMMRWPMGACDDPVDRYTRCFSYFLEIALDVGLVTEAGPGRGAAAWIPPDRFDSWAEHPWNQQRINELTDDGGRRYDAFWQWVDRHSPTGRLWQLDSIAVDPEFQGRGYGGALILAGLARARSDGAGAFLSTGTERNVSIYARYGFRVVDDLRAPGDGPRIWFMLWDP